MEKIILRKKNLKEKVIVGPAESMSKSKKNTVEPSTMIDKYGADAVRLFILSDSPPEKDIQWSEEGMIASYKFVQKLWLLHINITEILSKKQSADKNFNETENFLKFVNQIIYKITQNLEKFNYNVIIANLHELYNFMTTKIKFYIEPNILKENYIKLLNIMMPIIPHFSLECLDNIGSKKYPQWPIHDEKYIQEDELDYVIQINGKKKLLIKSKKDTTEKDLYSKFIKSDFFKKHSEEIKVKKIIFIKNRLMNIII